MIIFSYISVITFKANTITWEITQAAIEASKATVMALAEMSEEGRIHVTGTRTHKYSRRHEIKSKENPH